MFICRPQLNIAVSTISGTPVNVLPFLDHHAGGQMSFCRHDASVVVRPYVRPSSSTIRENRYFWGDFILTCTQYSPGWCV